MEQHQTRYEGTQGSAVHPALTPRQQERYGVSITSAVQETMNIKEYAVLHKVSESTARNRLEALVKEGKMKRVEGTRMLPRGGRGKTIDYREVT